MILKKITVNEKDDLLFGDAILNNEPDLAIFRYKTTDKKIVSYKDFDHDIKIQILKYVF